MSARRVPWRTVVAAFALAAVLAALAGAPASLRAPIVLLFLLLGPGMAYIPLLRLGDPVAELTLGLAVSVALDVAVGSSMLYAGVWSPRDSLFVLAGIALVGVALQRRSKEVTL